MGALVDGQPFIDAFMEFMPERDRRCEATVGSDTAPDMLVQAVMEKARAEPLWDGNWQRTYRGLGNSLNTEPAYPSQSEADFALLGEIVRLAVNAEAKDTVLADVAIRVFEQSGLYRDEKRAAITKHAIPKLIASALIDRDLRAEPSIRHKPEVKLPRLAAQEGMIEFTDEPPPPREYVLQDFILTGKACVLAGLGGVSKTMWLMQLSVCTALGLPFMSKRSLTGSVMLILGEEDHAEIHRRFNAIVKVMGLTGGQIDLVRNRVRAFPMNGLDARLSRVQNGSLEGTDFTAEIITATKELERDAGLPVRLIGLDHAGLIHGGEFNTREDVVQTMRQVNFIAHETHAAAMVLAHSPKGANVKDKADAADVAGSAAWVDLARAVFVIRTMNDDDGKNFGIAPELRHAYASLAVVKNNYGPAGDVIWLRRTVVGGYSVSVLDYVELNKPAPVARGSNAIQERILNFIKARPGQYSKTGLRDTHAGKDGHFKANKADVAAALEELLASGQIKLRAPTADEREQFGLGAQVKSVMEAM